MSERKLSGTALKRRQGAMSQMSAIAASTSHAVKPTASGDSKPVITDGVDSVPKGQEGRVLYIEDSKLLDDPLNEDYYGDLEDLENLASSMRDYGFQGVILAYPIGAGKYRIESGHRRRAAGRIAGISKFPVLPTEPPKTEWERRLRLFRGNLHSRKEKPMTVARVAQGLFESHSEEIRYKKDHGLLQEGEQTYANALVAADLDIQTSSVEKYRRLLKLIPELQHMADDGDAPWSDLSGAATLSEERQKKLAEEIRYRQQASGEQAVDRKWMKRTLGKLRESEPGSVPKRIERNRDDYSLFMKGSRNVIESLDYGKGFRGAEKDAVLSQLKELKVCVERAINTLSASE